MTSWNWIFAIIFGFVLINAAERAYFAHMRDKMCEPVMKEYMVEVNKVPVNAAKVSALDDALHYCF